MLDAATRVFASKGYAATTMKDIALEANYTAPAFYNYFKGKEELFDALVERSNREVLSCFEDPPAGEPSLEHRVEVLTRRIFALVDRRRETLHLLDSLQNGNQLPLSTRAAMAQRCNSDLLMRFGAWFQGSMDDEKLGQSAVQLAMAFYLAVIRALHAKWQSSSSEQSFETQTELAVELFLHGFSSQQKPSKLFGSH